MTEIPAEVRTLGDERQAARIARDFARADALRERIAELGYRVVDAPDGPAYERLDPVASRHRQRARDVASVLDEPPTTRASAQWVVEGWPADVQRGIGAMRRHSPRGDVQYVVADLTQSDPIDYGPGVEVLALDPGTGWAAARNAALRRASGEIVLVLDGSVEPTGDLLSAVEATLSDPSVGVCGPFGIVTSDLREFQESAGPEVDAIEGYLMAFRRDVLHEVGLFDERFAWYRTADVELCFRVKEAGYRAIVVDVPLARHVHRTWDSTAPTERARLSKRNFNQFLERFRGRFDLLVSPPGDR